MQPPRPDSNRGPYDPKSDAVTDWPLRLHVVVCFATVVVCLFVVVVVVVVVVVCYFHSPRHGVDQNQRVLHHPASEK